MFIINNLKNNILKKIFILNKILYSDDYSYNQKEIKVFDL